MRLLAALLALIASPAAAQPVVTSAAPEAVAVSLYRDPDRGVDDAIDLDDLEGFAVISETRTVDLPPGKATIRFEGVASGILPESAIVIGPPVAEKNQDRRLLSQRGLLDAFTGQRVTLRRTDPATGRVTEEPATIRSDPDRVVVQTAAGVEALRCTGLRETLLYPGVPPGLSAKPTLSVLTVDQPGGRLTVTLTYITSRFDWQADYIADLAPDARSASLLAWLTMASGDSTSFVDARTFALAGKVGRVEDKDGDDYGDRDDGAEPIRYSCWPAGTTTSNLAPPPVPPPPMMALEMASYDGEIVVTGSRVSAPAFDAALSVVAAQEALGDLKLYRIPVPVTVAARSQKQVAFLVKPRVKGEMVYRTQLYGSDADDVELLFRFRNRREDGLGEPLPGGQVTLYQTAGGRRALVGLSTVDARAGGPEVEREFGEAGNVYVEIEARAEGGAWARNRLVVTNANPRPIIFEAELRTGTSYRYTGFSGRLVKKPGKQVWRVTVPANGAAAFSYRALEVED